MSFDSISLGVVLGALVGWLGYQARALTASGAVAAALIGVVIFGFGGMGAAILVIIFFVSSSALTQFKAQQKETLQLNFEKGGRRDLWQVFANGGIAAILVILHAWSGSPIALVGFVGAMAVATADTWGTEIGVLSQRMPRSLLTWQSVPCGTSGGVTLLGTGATILGALTIGAAGLLVLGDWRVIPIGMIGGVLGATIDSLLGACWQGMYTCPTCEVETESHPYHRCGTLTNHQRGWRWLNNDAVNLAATIGGSGISVALAQFFL